MLAFEADEIHELKSMLGCTPVNQKHKPEATVDSTLPVWTWCFALCCFMIG